MIRYHAPSTLPAPRILFTAAVRAHRLAAAGALAYVIPWLAYTRLYFWLHPRNLTLEPSLFMRLTGRPDPFCGLTRTFAWMWRGDLERAFFVYSLGPILFAGGIGLVGYALVALASGRALRINLSHAMARTMIVLGGLALGGNWAAKLLWLGM